MDVGCEARPAFADDERAGVDGIGAGVREAERALGGAVVVPRHVADVELVEVEGHRAGAAEIERAAGRDRVLRVVACDVEDAGGADLDVAACGDGGGAAVVADAQGVHLQVAGDVEGATVGVHGAGADAAGQVAGDVEDAAGGAEGACAGGGACAEGHIAVDLGGAARDVEGARGRAVAVGGVGGALADGERRGGEGAAADVHGACGVARADADLGGVGDGECPAVHVQRAVGVALAVDADAGSADGEGVGLDAACPEGEGAGVGARLAHVVANDGVAEGGVEGAAGEVHRGDAGAAGVEIGVGHAQVGAGAGEAAEGERAAGREVHQGAAPSAADGEGVGLDGVGGAELDDALELGGGVHVGPRDKDLVGVDGVGFGQLEGAGALARARRRGDLAERELAEVGGELAGAAEVEGAFGVLGGAGGVVAYVEVGGVGRGADGEGAARGRVGARHTGGARVVDADAQISGDGQVAAALAEGSVAGADGAVVADGERAGLLPCAVEGHGVALADEGGHVGSGRAVIPVGARSPVAIEDGVGHLVPVPQAVELRVGQAGACAQDEAVHAERHLAGADAEIQGTADIARAHHVAAGWRRGIIVPIVGRVNAKVGAGRVGWRHVEVRSAEHAVGASVGRVDAEVEPVVPVGGELEAVGGDAAAWLHVVACRRREGLAAAG